MNAPGFLDTVKSAVRDAVGDDQRPVVVFSSAWPFLRAMGANDLRSVEQLLDALLEGIGHRTVLMPTFTDGFVNGRCDLDTGSSSTGVITECFRKRPGSRRTLSAYFSFAATGRDLPEFIDLRPADAWGDQSLYEWMERRDVCFLMFGTHATHSSYFHRAEWLLRKQIAYRYPKTFRGSVTREGRGIELEETLFVRRLDPPVVNDFTVLLPALDSAGLRRRTIEGIGISSHYAQPAMAAILDALERDPYLLVKNRRDYEARSA